MIYLICHFNSAGSGVGQAEIDADTEAEARERFAVLYPERQIQLVEKKDS